MDVPRKRVAMIVALGVMAILRPAVALGADGTIAPDPQDFGSVVINESPTATLTFTNTSGSDVTLTGVSIDNPAFALSAGTSGISCDTNPTVANGATCTEVVAFTPAVSGPQFGTFTISFSDATTVTSSVTGAGVVPPIHVVSTSLTPRVFYPLVRDGFRDFTNYSFALNESATGSVQIFNHKGTLTRSFPFTNRDHLTVAWGGVNHLGTRVKPGMYRIRVTAHLPGRMVTSPFLRAQVKTGFRTQTTVGSKSKLGRQWSSRGWSAFSIGGSCNWGTLSGGELLSTCLFAHANVGYTFALPRGAKVTAFRHRVVSGIEPCRHKVWTTSHVGRIHRATFTHGSANAFSQCDIGTVTMSYRVTRRIKI